MTQGAQAITVAVITGLCYAVPSIVSSYVNRAKVQAKLQDLHLQINSRLDELIKARELAAHAKGVADQKQIATDDAKGQTERHG